VLELIDSSTAIDIAGGALRVTFPGAILPDVRCFEIEGGESPLLCVVVATTSRIVYRFVFDHPVNTDVKVRAAFSQLCAPRATSFEIDPLRRPWR
jgi:hypothetical protein